MAKLLRLNRKNNRKNDHRREHGFRMLKYWAALILIMTIHPANAMEIEGPPEYRVYDANQVNLMTGRRSINKNDLAISAGDLAFTHTIISHDDMFLIYADNFFGSITFKRYADIGGLVGPDEYTVSSGNGSNTFLLIDGVYTDRKGAGETLEKLSNAEWLYTSQNGTKTYFSEAIQLLDGNHSGFSNGHFPAETHYGLANATRVVYPNGLAVQLHFKSRVVSGFTQSRIQSVTTSNGLQFKYVYRSNSATSTWDMWSLPSSITAINNTVDYCNPTANSCTYTQTWPTVQYSWPVNIQTQGGDFVITEPDGRRSTYKHELFCRYGAGTEACDFNRPRITKVTESTSSGPITSRYEYGNQTHCYGSVISWVCDTLRVGLIKKSIKGGAEWNYSYSQPPFYYVPFQNQSNGPSGNSLVALISSFSGVPYQINDYENDVEFRLSDDYKNRVDSVNYDYGNRIEFSHDAIGNITERREIAKASSGLADIV